MKSVINLHLLLKMQYNTVRFLYCGHPWNRFRPRDSTLPLGITIIIQPRHKGHVLSSVERLSSFRGSQCIENYRESDFWDCKQCPL